MDAIKALRNKSVKIFTSGDSVFGYNAWPSVCRGPGGELLSVCSGKRLSHLCPFGKVLLSRSYDEGHAWTAPETVIDTPLDDRDAGICVFGDGRLIVTSFNHPVSAQLNFNAGNVFAEAMKQAYLTSGRITPECEARYQGSVYVISKDGGRTWGMLRKAPVTSPHGPAVLPDGSLLYIGNPWIYDTSIHKNISVFGSEPLEVWHSADGETPASGGKYSVYGAWEKWAEIDSPVGDVFSCEAHAAVLNADQIIVQMRVQSSGGSFTDGISGNELFCIYQSRSEDGGHTWSKAERIINYGSPPHLLLHSSGALISSFGFRRPPYSEHITVSNDRGLTWSGEAEFSAAPDADIGYPASVELRDGSVLTVYYQKEHTDRQCEIFGVIWRLEEV